MWCFMVNSDATSYNETLQVYLNLAEAIYDNSEPPIQIAGYKPGTSQLLIVALYDETLRLSFDTEKVTSVELIS